MSCSKFDKEQALINCKYDIAASNLKSDTFLDLRIKRYQAIDAHDGIFVENSSFAEEIRDDKYIDLCMNKNGYVVPKELSESTDFKPDHWDYSWRVFLYNN